MPIFPRFADFVQHLARLFESGKKCVIDVRAMERVARKLAAEDKRYAPLVYPFCKTTDMQGEHALGYLVACPEYQQALLAEGLEREFCVLEAIGMAWLAEDMPGMEQSERTRRIELVRALMVYNICGDDLYQPHRRELKNALGLWGCEGWLRACSGACGRTLPSPRHTQVRRQQAWRAARRALRHLWRLRLAEHARVPLERGGAR